MKRTVCIICIVIICSIYATAALLLSKEEFSIISAISEKGEYILHQQELVPREDISSFIVDDGRLYVFYDDAALVNVYLLDGSFSYGLQVCTFENGHGDIAIHDGTLYVASRMAIIYAFRGGQLIDSIQPSDNYQRYITTREIFSMKKNHVYEGNVIMISESSNQIIYRDTQEPIISLPQKSILGESLLIAATLFLGILLYIPLKSHIGKC